MHRLTTLGLGWLRLGLAAVVIGAMSAAFAISFVAVVYSGPLQAYLGQGIGLALVGSAVMAGVGALLYQMPGKLCQPQETTAILVAGATTAMAASPVAATSAPGATAAMIVVAASVVAGVVAWLCGRFRLGFLARFVPYTVLGGFLAASGYVLLTGGIGLVLRHHFDIWEMHLLAEPGALMRLAPWMAAGLALVVLTRSLHHELTLPFALVALLASFYLWLALSGTTLAEAEAMGLLLGPFPEGQMEIRTILPMILQADLGLVLGHMPTFLGVAGLTVLGTLLNSSGLEIALSRPTDFNRALRHTGIVNLVSAGAGGMPGYPMIGETLLASRLGLRGAMGGMSILLVCLATAVFGSGVIAALPVGLFGAVIAYLGIDMLYTWLWVERRRLPHRDFGIVVLILACAALIGFLESIAIGLVVAALIFIATYARQDVVRLRSTAASRRSRVERTTAEAARLTLAGRGAVILELSGFVFFGTAHSLLERVREELATPGITDLVIDFARVSGIDTSATFTLGRIRALCQADGVRLVYSGMNAEVRESWQLGSGEAAAAEAGGALAPDLDTALQGIEDRLLSQAGPEDSAPEDLLAELQAAAPGAALDRLLEEVHLDRGGVLIRQGSSSQAIYLLRRGRMRAEVRQGSGAAFVVARFRPGAVIGEIALYAGQPRTADVVADTEAELIRFDTDRIAEDPALAAAFHSAIAGRLARRVVQTTLQLRDTAV